MYQTFKQFLASNDLDHEGFEAKTKEEQLVLLKKYNVENEKALKTLSEKVDSGITKEQMEEMKAELKRTHELEIKTVREDSRDNALAIQKLLKGYTGGGTTESDSSQISKFIADNMKEIKNIKSRGAGMIEFTTKAVASITTGSAVNVGTVPGLVGTQMAPAGNVNLRGVIVNELITIFQTDLAAYPYTETTPKDGDYTFVAEGGSKPQIDFKIETRYAEPVKAAAHIVLTDESIKDVRGMQDIANNYLRAKHDLKRQNGILFGDGISPNPKGATEYGRTFVAGAMALAVTTPNFMDVVNACITDIFTTHNYTDEMPYLANIVMINPVDFFLELVSAKDDNGLPLYPQAGLFNRVTIGGATIIPFEDIPSGEIFVADLSRYKTTNYVPYTVRIGFINDQLITNQFTMVGESRFHAFVEQLDEQAFIFDTIATVQAAITAV